MPKKEKKPPKPNTATETTYLSQGREKPLLMLEGPTFRPFKMSPGKAWAIVENYAAIKAFAAKHMALPKEGA